MSFRQLFHVEFHAGAKKFWRRFERLATHSTTIRRRWISGFSHGGRRVQRHRTPGDGEFYRADRESDQGVNSVILFASELSRKEDDDDHFNPPQDPSHDTTSQDSHDRARRNVGALAYVAQEHVVDNGHVNDDAYHSVNNDTSRDHNHRGPHTNHHRARHHHDGGEEPAAGLAYFNSQPRRQHRAEPELSPDRSLHLRQWCVGL
jgi:hypothetical protein